MTIQSTIVQYRGEAPVENSLMTPLWTKSLGYEAVKNSLQNLERIIYLNVDANYILSRRNLFNGDLSSDLTSAKLADINHYHLL